MITIKEIAEEAGVSATTVSNVLHGKINKVSPQMVEKIQNLLQEHNYIPRFGLNALTSRGSKMIGVLISTPEFVEGTLYEKPFYGTAISTLEEWFRARGYYIIVFSSKSVDEIMRMALGWNVDGVISISMPKKYCQKISELTGKPMVSIDMDVNHEEEADDSFNVTSPDEEAGRLMVNYLADQGIREIIYFANVMRGADYRRYIGASEAYKEYFGEEKTLELILLDRTFEERCRQFVRLKKRANQGIALFFSNDLSAVEAIGCFVREGILIPQGFSIVGMDDDIYARLAVPRLTTIRIASAKKAAAAAEMLLDIVEGKMITKRNEKIQIELVERESVLVKTLQET